MCEEGKLTKSLQKRAVTPCVHACGGYYTPVHKSQRARHTAYGYVQALSDTNT